MYRAWAALRYLGVARGSAMLWCWAWSRILITSIGVTTATASVIPAARPATLREAFNCFYFLFLFFTLLPRGI